VLENVVIVNVERLEDSLIGKNAKVMKNPRGRGIQLHIGDYSEVGV
jgi:glucose-1-phosphate thymidylyltransferase